jgi:hypothetical protein
MAHFGDLMRHDRAGEHLHSSKCKAIGIETTKGHARTHTHIYIYIHTHVHTRTHIHTHTNQYVNMEMGECYEIKRQKLQQIGQIHN